MLVITVARKPLEEPTVARNALVYGTGGLNIDASRIGTGTVKQATAGTRTIKWGIGEGGCSYEKGTGAVFSTEGRWPANLILSDIEDVRAAFPDTTSHGGGTSSTGFWQRDDRKQPIGTGGSGSASRFFKVIKS